MNMERFFDSLTQWGISVHLDENGALRVKGKKEKLTAAVVTQLKAHKTEIAAWLRHTQPQHESESQPAPVEVAATKSEKLTPSQQAAFDELTLHGLFEVQAVEHPERIAVQYAGSALTYAQLNLQANRLAYYLRQQGLEAEGVVALAITPSCDQLIAVLAVLKAGGAYLPLDSDWDDDTLVRVMQEGEVARVLCDKEHLDMVSVLPCEVDNLDDDELKTQLNECSGANPSLLETQSAYSLAAILYTRGLAEIVGQDVKSKGVMIEHGNIISVIKWPQFIDSAADAHLVMNFPLTSRWSMLNLFTAWCHGGCIYQFLPANDSWLVDNVSCLTFLAVDAAQLELVLTHVPKLLVDCQSLILVGEPPKADVLNQVFAHRGDMSIVQVYGCLESGLFATWHPLLLASDTKRLGQSIAASKCYVLDEQLRPVSKGDIGQIYIGGLNVARGYADGWQLSEQYFIPCPFSDDPNEHIFATGDNGSVLGNGEVMFAGRERALPIASIDDRLVKLFTEPKEIIDDEPVVLPERVEVPQEEFPAEDLPQYGTYLQPIWYSKPLNTVDHHHWSRAKCYVLFNDSFGIAQQLVTHLQETKQQVICVNVGEGFAKLISGDISVFEINPANVGDYELLLAALNELGVTSIHIVHLWSLTLFGLAASCEPIFEQLARLNQHQLKGVVSVERLITAIEQSTIKLSSLTCVSHDILSVTDDETLIPSAAMVSACIEAYPQHRIHHIDLSLAKPIVDGVLAEQLSRCLYDELTVLHRPQQVAYRGKQRWLGYMAAPSNGCSGVTLSGYFVIIGNDLALLSDLIECLVKPNPQLDILLLSDNVAVVNHEFTERVDTLLTPLADFNQLQQRLAQVSIDVGRIDQLLVLPSEDMAFDIQAKLLLSLDTLFSQYPCEVCSILSPTFEAVVESKPLLSSTIAANHHYHRAFAQGHHQHQQVRWRCIGYTNSEGLSDINILPNLLVAQTSYCVA